jgi:hypothetical protein
VDSYRDYELFKEVLEKCVERERERERDDMQLIKYRLISIA